MGGLKGRKEKEEMKITISKVGKKSKKTRKILAFKVDSGMRQGFGGY